MANGIYHWLVQVGRPLPLPVLRSRRMRRKMMFRHWLATRPEKVRRVLA